MVFGNANFVEANHPLVTVDSIKHVGEQEPGGLTLVRATIKTFSSRDRNLRRCSALKPGARLGLLYPLNNLKRQPGIL